MVAESPPALDHLDSERDATPSEDGARRARLHRRIWIGAIAVVALLVVLRNLVDLSGSPPGMYVDESSIAYNAWTIAHFGVDEHGIHWPLFFEAFGEYKNPVYVYSVALLARFLPLTVTVERLPAAFFGLAVVGFLTAAAWRITASRALTFGTLVLTALTPWVVIESRVGFETISWVALLSAALWCLSRRTPTPRQFGWAGVFLAVCNLRLHDRAPRGGPDRDRDRSRLGDPTDAGMVARAGAGRDRLRGPGHIHAAQPRGPDRALQLSQHLGRRRFDQRRHRPLRHQLLHLDRPEFSVRVRRCESSPEHADRRNAVLGDGAAAGGRRSWCAGSDATSR